MHGEYTTDALHVTKLSLYTPLFIPKELKVNIYMDLFLGLPR